MSARRVAWFLLLAVCGAVLYVSVSTDREEVLASVGGEVLTQEEADREVESRISADRDRLSPDQLAELRQITRDSVSREFINRQALLAEVDRRGIKVDPSAIEKRWASVQSDQPPRWSSADILRIHLIGQGKTRAEVEEGLRIEILLNELMTADIEVSEADIQQYREEHANHLMSADKVDAEQIFISIPENANAETMAASRELAESIRARLLAGEAFDQVAGDYPDTEVRYRDASRSIKRGESLLREVDEVLFSIPTDTVGPVIESEFGCHIVKVIFYEKGSMPDDSALRIAVEQEKKSDRLHRFMDALME